MPSDEQKAGSNDIAGNGGTQPTDATTKMGADSLNTNANSSLQPATPAMQAEPTPATTTAPPAGQVPPAGPAQPGAEPTQPADAAAASAPPTHSPQPNVYGGNFGNDVQNSFQDHDRASNQRSDANRGEFGQQEYNQGNTHGGYGNQFREFDTAAERPGAEATEEKYYGQGAAEPGLQHNGYQAYDGRDLVPDQQGHAVTDTTPVAARHPANAGAGPGGAASPADNRNRPGRAGQSAAFQNDNGSPTTGGGYAADYGHTSGAGLPAGTPDHYKPTLPGDQNQQNDQASPRGGYDSQSVPSKEGVNAPAPIDAPDAPQGAGYGYGHERSEEAKPGNPDTGNSRSGFGGGGSKEGDVSQGHGSKGGSYDDQNPGARGPEYDNLTSQEKAKNYGQANRDDYRPADDQDADHGPAPRRNAGRDEPAQ